MNQILKNNQNVQTETTKLPCKIEKLLGAGTQGEVYRAELNGKKVAVKWYFKSSATAYQRSSLEDLVKKGPPNDKFLWPLELVSDPGIAGFGYIMKLREDNFKNIVDLMNRVITPNLKTIATIGLELSNSFFQLHSKGLCYRDISFGNAFFDPINGDVRICDNDNVCVDGCKIVGVIGTPKFMAPEIVIGKALPSTNTDLYSLAVMLHYLLYISHPLEGKLEHNIKCMDLPAMNKIYGSDPIYIFDPINKSNRPVPGYHDNAILFDKIYPKFIKEMFLKSFVQGIKEPDHGRVRETEWRKAMARLRDSIFPCRCNAENFFDAETISETGSKPKCWNCKKELSIQPRIKFGSNNNSKIVVLSRDAKIYQYHIDDTYDFSTLIGEISTNPKDPQMWGIKNLTKTKWVIRTPDGSLRDIEPGKSVPLADGIKINFGKCEGEIRAN